MTVRLRLVPEIALQGNQIDFKNDQLTPQGRPYGFAAGAGLEIQPWDFLSLRIEGRYFNAPTNAKEIPGSVKPAPGEPVLGPTGVPLAGDTINNIDQTSTHLARHGFDFEIGPQFHFLGYFSASAGFYLQTGAFTSDDAFSKLYPKLDGAQKLTSFGGLGVKARFQANLPLSDNLDLSIGVAYHQLLNGEATGKLATVEEGLNEVSAPINILGGEVFLGLRWDFLGGDSGERAAVPDDEREAARAPEPGAKILEALRAQPPVSRGTTDAPVPGADAGKAADKAPAPGAPGGAETPAAGAGGPGTPSPLPEAVKATSGAGAAEVTPTGPTGTSTATKAAPQKGVPVVEDRRYGDLEAPKVE